MSDFITLNGQQIDLFTIHETHINCACGTLIQIESANFVDGYGYYCRHCFSSEFSTSLHDGNTHHYHNHDLIFGNNGAILRSLIPESYFRCYATNNIHPIGDCVMLNDRRYHRDYVPPSHRIHNYSYRPKVKYIDSRSAKKLYFGVELEISGGGNDERTVSRVLETVNSTDADKYLYAKYDSSVHNGFEIVSRPHSFKALMKHEWNNLLDTAKRLGFNNNAKAGLHVHMSKKFFGDSESSQDQGLMKLIYLVEKFWQEFFVFSRRDENAIQQYAKPFGLRDRSPDRLLNAFKQHQRYGDNSRYSAVNLINRSTAELRFFRTTLDNTTLLATYQLCYELANFCNKVSLVDVVDIDWQSFVSEISQHDELSSYLSDKSLINPNSDSLITESIVNSLF